ncbi:MAG: lytic transglycosylase domain-containing protein [Prolixibacteraceae bacterium]|nr:lytic transglycosylase domain-containing protein [Prolixibacteraceae bacterium]MBN2650655.1 lytic transglycosylase domain-containing protein [Prolixibacteraceae bacterium]
MSRKKLSIISGISIIAILLAGFLFTSYQTADNETNNEAAPDEKKQVRQEVTPPPIPEQLIFAGEPVPLDNFDVHESLDRELLVNTYFHSQTLRFMKMAPRFFHIIEPILKENNIPDDFKYLAMAESGFNTTAVSPAGAVGIWQFMKSTAIEYGLEISPEIDERYNIEKATVAACAYLHESYEKYGNWTTVAASYNAGRRGIDREIERQKETHYYNLLLNPETARYVFRILALKTIMENPEDYGFYFSKKDLYPIIPTKNVEISSSVANFSDFAQEHNTNYKILKYFNPWLRDTTLTNHEGKTYEIIIPKGKYRSY